MKPLSLSFLMTLLILLALPLSGQARSCCAPTKPCCSPSASMCAVVSPQQWSGQQAATETGQVVIARTPAEWEALWQQTGEPHPVALNPQAQVGVGIFLGTRNTGGYGVQLVSSQIQGEDLVIVYTESRPAPDDMVSQALTSPWLIGLFPRPQGEVRVLKAQ